MEKYKTDDLMTVQDALTYEQGARLCVNDHPNFRDDCHQCTAWLAVREHLISRVPLVEKALRAAYKKGFQENTPGLGFDSDFGVAAGIAVLNRGERP